MPSDLKRRIAAWCKSPRHGVGVRIALKNWIANKKRARSGGSWHPAMSFSRRAIVTGLLAAGGAATADAAVFLRFATTAAVTPPASNNYDPPKLTPSANWDGTRANMVSLTPALAQQRQGVPGETDSFAEAPISALDERPGVWIDDAAHIIVAMGVNGDQMRTGMAYAIGRLGDSSVISTQMIYTSRKTCGFPFAISSLAGPNGRDGDAMLTVDVVPMRGDIMRLTLPITLATRGELVRPPVYCNPDPDQSVSFIDRDTGQSVTLPPGNDNVQLSNALANPAAYPFRSPVAAASAFAGYMASKGACDIKVAPNTVTSWMADVAAAPLNPDKLTANFNTRETRVRCAVSGAKYTLGRNDKTAFYRDPNGDPYTYVPASKAYGGLDPAAVGVPLIDSEGEVVEPRCYLRDASQPTRGQFNWTIQALSVQDARIDLSTFRAMTLANIDVTSNIGYMNSDGTWNYETAQAFYSFVGCDIVDPFGTNGPINSYSNNQNPIQSKISLGRIQSFCDCYVVAPSAMSAIFNRNIRALSSYDTVYIGAQDQAPVYWNYVGKQDQVAMTRQSQVSSLKISNMIYREDNWAVSPYRVQTTDGRVFTTIDSGGNPVSTGFTVGMSLLLQGSGPDYKVAVIGSISGSGGTFTVTTGLSGTLGVVIETLPQMSNQCQIAADGRTVTCLNANGFPTIAKTVSGRIFVIRDTGVTFKTTVQSINSDGTMVLADAYPRVVAGKLISYRSGFTVVNAKHPSANAGGYNNFYYVAAGRGQSPRTNSSFYMNDNSNLSGCFARALTGAMAGVADIDTAGSAFNELNAPQTGIYQPNYQPADTTRYQVQAVLTVTGTPGARIRNAQATHDPSDGTALISWQLPISFIIPPSGQVDVIATAQLSTASAAVRTAPVAAGAINTIKTPITGLTSVNNAAASVTGYSLPTMSTTGTALKLAQVPPSSVIVAYDMTALYIGQSIINHATEEARIVVALDPTDSTKATLNAAFSSDAVAVQYRTGGVVIFEGDVTTRLAIGDKFWAGATAHADYFQVIGASAGSQFLTNSANSFFWNYTLDCFSSQIGLPQGTRFAGLGTLTVDSTANGIISSAQASYTVTTTTSGQTTTGTTSAAHGLFPKQRIAILDGNGNVVQIAQLITASGNTFTFAAGAASAVTGASLLIGHTVIPGDSLYVGPVAPAGAIYANWLRRVTATTWDADFTQRVVFNEPFPAAVYPNGFSSLTYTQQKQPRNVAFVNGNYYYRGVQPTGGGYAESLTHFVWINNTGVQPFSNGGYGFTANMGLQNCGFFDSIAQNLNSIGPFIGGTYAGRAAAGSPKDITVDNTNVLALDPKYGNPNDQIAAIAFSNENTAPWVPASRTHLRVKGKLSPDGTSAGVGLVPFDAQGNRLIPGVSFVGGAQPIAA